MTCFFGSFPDEYHKRVHVLDVFPRIAAVLRERREAGRCYTFVGDLLIALDAADAKNKGDHLESLQRGEPHIFSLTR